MDCSEFRRQLLIDPRAPGLADAAQQRVCEDAPARLAEALALEQRIDAALAVPLPQGLAERVIAALPSEPVQSPARWWPLALAASLLLSALIGWSWLRAPAGGHGLIADSVEHLSHEPYALTRTDEVPAALVERMFAESGIRLAANPSGLTYLNRCPLGERMSVHMVMAGAQGPVTVLYVPGERVERMDTRFEMVAVRTLPFASGALVLLAESNRDFDRIEHAWHVAGGEVVAGL